MGLGVEMSEEKPVFKVKDRRLFNADGTPREVEREAEPTPAAAASQAETANTASANASTRDVAATNESSRADAFSSGASAGAPPASSSESRGRERATGAEASADPNAFVNLLMFIASPAAAALGISEHPGMPAHDIDLPLAKHCIDLLGTLRQKSSGNLSAQEEQIFEGLLAELRMQFVALSGARPGGGFTGGKRGGFSGSDITGGR